MEFLYKVGNKKPSIDLAERAKYHRDGQLGDIRPNGVYSKLPVPKGLCLIRTPHDYYDVVGTRDWKSINAKVYDLKKYLYVADAKGRYPWDIGYDETTCPQRKRDWFTDFKDLLDKGLIDLSTFESIYDKGKIHKPIYLEDDFLSYLVHEDVVTRKISDYSNRSASESAGTFEIGTGGGAVYATVTAFELDIAAQLTGNLTGEHQDEETALGASITFDTDTNTHLLKLTAVSGVEHNGGAYGNGARIVYATSVRMYFDETDNGTLDDVEVSNLALDISANETYGIAFDDGGDSGVLTAQRLLIKGGGGSYRGISTSQSCYNAVVRNCIIYSVGSGQGLRTNADYSGRTLKVYNNTICKCQENIYQDAADMSGTVKYKNNLTQGGTNKDWSDDDVGGGFGTTAKNISEDATSPDVAYRSKDLHTDTVFERYNVNDYRLNGGGDATNLAIVDDGENLYGDGVTVDIIGTARDNGTPFFIGASHTVIDTVNIGVIHLARAKSPFQKPFLGEQINWAHPLAKGLVGCWVMNERTGNLVNDLSGNKRNAAFVNSPLWKTGRKGAEIYLSGDGGTSDYLSIPAFNFTTNLMTIVAILELDGAQNDWTGIAYARGGSVIAGIDIRTDAVVADELGYSWNELRWDFSSGISLPNGRPILTAMAHEPTQTTLYLGDQGKIQAATDTFTHTSETFDFPLHLGADLIQATRYLKGAYYTVYVWNERALNTEDISQLYRELYSVFELTRRYWFVEAGGVTHELSGQIDGLSALSGIIKLNRKITGQFDGLSVLSAALKTTKKIVGQIDGLSSIDGNIKATKKINGTIAGQSTLSGLLGLTMALSGEISSVSVLSGSLGLERAISGGIDGVSTLSGLLGLTLPLSGSIDAVSTMSGALSLIAVIELTGSIDAISALSAALKTTKGLAGSIDAQSDISGAINLIAKLVGNIAATSDISGNISLTLALSGNISAISELIGILSVIGVGLGVIIDTSIVSTTINREFQSVTTLRTILNKEI